MSRAAAGSVNVDILLLAHKWFVWLETGDVQTLLAQIDELKGDLRAAETELHDCLKYAKDSLTGDKAKQELARLDSAPN